MRSQLVLGKKRILKAAPPKVCFPPVLFVNRKVGLDNYRQERGLGHRFDYRILATAMTEYWMTSSHRFKQLSKPISLLESVDPGGDQRLRVFAKPPIETGVGVRLMGARDGGAMVAEVRELGGDPKGARPIARRCRLPDPR